MQIADGLLTMSLVLDSVLNEVRTQPALKDFGAVYMCSLLFMDLTLSFDFKTVIGMYNIGRRDAMVL